MQFSGDVRDERNEPEVRTMIRFLGELADLTTCDFCIPFGYQAISVCLSLLLLIVDWTTKETVTPTKNHRTSLVFAPGHVELSDRFVLEQVLFVLQQVLPR